ncbi:MAG TPA: hypothetical protein VGK67_13045 [Myxococcales bacterium]
MRSTATFPARFTIPATIDLSLASSPIRSSSAFSTLGALTLRTLQAPAPSRIARWHV